MKLNKRSALALLFSLTLIVSGCGQNQSASDSSTNSANTPASAETEEAKLNVEVSFYPMYEFTKNVAGDLANVHTLVPAGTEPHDWEPTPQDIASIEKADVLVYNGAGMESWIDQVTDSLSNAKLIQVEASHGIDLLEGSAEDEHEHEHADDATTEEHDHNAEAEETHTHDHDHGGLDPHVWLSPALAVKEVRNIEAGLAKAAPEHAEQFKQNADTYVAKLEALDQDFKAAVTDSKRKDFITQHAAFAYLAQEYGLQQVPIAGLSPEQEPSAAQMAAVIDFAKEHQVKTIFFETLVSSKVSETIANEVGAKTAVLNPIEGLSEEEIAAGLDYIGVMRQNLEALKLALNE